MPRVPPGTVDRRPLVVNWPDRKLPTFRPQQHETLDAWRDAGPRGPVAMPTGTGKSEVALGATAEAELVALVVSPIRNLMYQEPRRIQRGLGYVTGILGDRLVDMRPVTVTTHDSAYICMPEIGYRFGLVVFDEVRHLRGKCRREAALFSTAPIRLGLTAAPERADGLDTDLEWLVGPVVYELRLA